jgi:citrate synthase
MLTKALLRNIPSRHVRRYAVTQDISGLRAKMTEVIPKHVEYVKAVKAKHNDKVICKVTVDQCYGGMRDIISLVTETSLLDAQEGIRFRGLSIPECQAQLPTTKGASEPTPESLFWLLMTGEIPTQQQMEGLTAEWNARAGLPKHVETVIDSFPSNMHPMSQFSAAVLALQTESVFAKKYAAGFSKKEYWGATYDDAMNLIANLHIIAARIYRNLYRKGQGHIAFDKNLDYGANYAKMLGFGDVKNFADLMRLYLVIHSDHEGGNVSAHTTHLVASALSDPYLAFSAGLNGLAGPLHGLANQEVLVFLKNLQQELGGQDVTNDQLRDKCKAILASGRVIPGYGHAVLRKTDPRFTCQAEFAKKHIQGDKLVKLVGQLYEVVPQVLLDAGKAKNPWPNVDAHSGCLLVHYNLVEENYYTVMFGVSRALGVMAATVWDRALGFPLERPKSVTTEWIDKNDKWF